MAYNCFRVRSSTIVRVVLLTMAGDDAGAFLQLPQSPNVRSDVMLAENGSTLSAQNYLGSLNRDWLRAIEWVGRFLPVGFYYRAFYKPKGAWRLWEPLIRRLAGLGKVSREAQPTYSDKEYRFADVAIVGGGPAGLEAALAAAEAGAETMLIDDQPALGGSLNYARYDVDYEQTKSLRNTLLDRVAQQPKIEILSNAKCTGWFDDNWLAVALPKPTAEAARESRGLCYRLPGPAHGLSE